MRYRWPENTQFEQVVLTVEQEVCSVCQSNLHVCDHRFHPILSLQGPLRLVCKLAHCPDPACPAHRHTLSPLAEAQITLPYWLIGWDVFCWASGAVLLRGCAWDTQRRPGRATAPAGDT